MPFNGVAHPASEVFDEMAERTRLSNIDTKNGSFGRQILQTRALLGVAPNVREVEVDRQESFLLAEENKIMSMNRDDMDDLTKTWHPMTRREILKRRMEDSAPYGGMIWQGDRS
ncbi:ALA-interacting subunit 1 [Hordeum vulgare]|nr:ALA-interacting subunit 1 [Hordeum vulgare]